MRTHYLCGLAICAQVSIAKNLNFSQVKRDLASLETIDGAQAMDKELTQTQTKLQSKKIPVPKKYKKDLECASKRPLKELKRILRIREMQSKKIALGRKAAL